MRGARTRAEARDVEVSNLALADFAAVATLALFALFVMFTWSRHWPWPRPANGAMTITTCSMARRRAASFS